jgi:hypothetical protein
LFFLQSVLEERIEDIVESQPRFKALLLTAREDILPRDTFVCPICRKSKRGEMFHCRDHCMDMCGDHVRETGQGLFVCEECDKIAFKFLHNGIRWVEA